MEANIKHRLENADVISSFYWKVWNQQNIGSRKQQQDCMGAVLGAYHDKPALIAILADGMGGMKDGAAFSEKTVEYYYESFQKALDRFDNPAMLLLSLAYGANKAVHAIYDPDKPGGTTLVTALMIEKKLYTLSIGDSRIYLFRQMRRQARYLPLQLNREHNLGHTLDARAWMGYISFEDADDNLYRDSLTSCIGPETIRHIDLQRNPIHLLGGDKVVLMSDGIYRTLSDRELTACMDSPPEQITDTVIARVLEKKAPHQDNMSIIVVDCVC